LKYYFSDGRDVSNDEWSTAEIVKEFYPSRPLGPEDRREATSIVLHSSFVNRHSKRED